MKETRAPFLDKGEEVLLSRQGLYKESLRSGWKPGHFYLTNQRILFYQPPRITFQTPFSNITGITEEKKAVILRTKAVISLSYRPPGRDEIRKAWMAIGDLETWRKRIYERTLLRIDEGALDKIRGELDPESQAILIHLWHNRHAPIDELASLCEASSHMDVLLKIRDIINPTAERVLGYSILTFEKSRTDEITGKRVTFSWWLTGRKVVEEKKRKSLVDIFDEGDYLNIVMELPGAREEDILVGVEGNKLSLSTAIQGRKYQEEISLPVEVKSKGFSKRYNNNILEIRVQKAGK